MSIKKFLAKRLVNGKIVLSYWNGTTEAGASIWVKADG